MSSDEDENEIRLQNSKKFRNEEAEKNNKSPSNGTKKPNLSKLNSKPTKLSPKKEKHAVDPMVMFGAETKRIPMKKPARRKEASLLELENDQIDESLMEIDLEKEFNSSVEKHKKEQKQTTPKSEEKKEKSSKTPNGKSTTDIETSLWPI